MQQHFTHPCTWQKGNATNRFQQTFWVCYFFVKQKKTEETDIAKHWLHCCFACLNKATAPKCLINCILKPILPFSLTLYVSVLLSRQHHAPINIYEEAKGKWKHSLVGMVRSFGYWKPKKAMSVTQIQFIFLWFLAIYTPATFCANLTHDHRALIIDGKRRVLVSGSIHYPRSTPEVSLYVSIYTYLYVYLDVYAYVYTRNF